MSEAKRANKARSAERFARDRVEPAIGKTCLKRPDRGWCIERAATARSGDLDELPVGGLVDTSDGYAVIRRDQAVAGVDQLGRRRSFAAHQPPEGCGAHFGLGVCC